MPRRFRRSALLTTISLAVLVFLDGSRSAGAADPAPAFPATTPPAIAASLQPVVTAIGVVGSATGTQVTISADSDLTYEYFVIEGKSLAIDIPGARSAVWPADQSVADDFVSRIQVAAQTGEKPGLRVVLSLRKPDAFTVSGDGRKIAVVFVNQPGVVPPGQSPLSRIGGVSATRIANAFRVTVKSDAKLSYRVLESGDPKRITIAIDGARLEPGSEKSSDFSGLETPVTRIATWSEPEDPAVVLVAIDLRQPLPFRVFTDVYGLNVDISIEASGRTETAAGAPQSPSPAPGPTRSDLPAASVLEPANAPRNYAGRKITLDFLDADINDILRLIADVSGMNIVATDDVKGKRSVKMTEVPWDQALDLILKTSIPPLAQIADGENVIRIVTLSRLTQEQSEVEEKKLKNLKLQEDGRRLSQLREAALEEAKLLKTEKQRREEVTKRALSQPLQDQTIALHNAELLYVWRDVRDILTERSIIRPLGLSGSKTVTESGAVAAAAAATEMKTVKYEWRVNEETCPNCLIQIDERTKTFFFRMYPLYLSEVLHIIKTLDTPRKIDSVLIEARIVEVVSDFSQALGIQWGGAYAADPAHGNATQYAFPNSIGVGGTQPGNYLVNLPATNAVAGIGLSLGHIANTLSLDVKLSALEKLGKTKILSNPKIVTLNNKSAKINIGSQLPIPSTDTLGNRNVTWKDVGILLDVTPEITSDNKVVMKVNIEKSSKGITVSTTEGDMFSIERRGAETNVIVADGDTTVIGGIYIQIDSDNRSGVPWLSKIPLLGWLFKADSKSTDRTELMIFLTPKINRYQ